MELFYASKAPWKVLEFLKFLSWALSKSYLIFLCLCAFDFLNFALKIQTLKALLSSKLWYHLHSMELFLLGNHRETSNKRMKNNDEKKIGSNLSHEFIYCFVDMIGSSWNCHFSLSNTYISGLKGNKINSRFVIWGMRLHARFSRFLNFLRMLSFTFLEWTWISRGEWSFALLEGLQMYLN